MNAIFSSFHWSNLSFFPAAIRVFPKKQLSDWRKSGLVFGHAASSAPTSPFRIPAPLRNLRLLKVSLVETPTLSIDNKSTRANQNQKAAFC